MMRGKARYLGRKCTKDRVVTTRFRLQSETRTSRYWLQDYERSCRCFDKVEKTLNHVLEICEITGEEGGHRGKRSKEQHVVKEGNIEKIVCNRGKEES